MPPLEMLTGRSQDAAENVLLTELLSAWDGCQKYFYRSWARRTALQHAARELGVGNIERCRGFCSHLFKLLLGTEASAGPGHRAPGRPALTSSIQSLKAHTQTPSEDWGCTLPPQDPLLDWGPGAGGSVRRCPAAAVLKMASRGSGRAAGPL
ncbi:hypothetical protein OJAV_G00136740 [Oryzias javanicus]|uniref:Uncharacterized protein n=1 Tax=Oryzias javanicus TaxID=123683 RepID=A0A3S2PX53_ORYJA|nr:hypothetical protein OJAV_G00136740 [Oryzias javanicus]